MYHILLTDLICLFTALAESKLFVVELLLQSSQPRLIESALCGIG